MIGDCDGLADLVVERYDEALHGDIRMNCDTCVYRVPLPGFEDKLGAPQTRTTIRTTRRTAMGTATGMRTSTRSLGSEYE